MNLIKHTKILTKIITANITKKWFPLFASLTVTNRCNLKCIYCYGSYFTRNIADFPTKFWLDLIDKLKSMGCELIHLEGGEPLIRDDIQDLINHVKKRKMLCRLNSNGLLVPKKIKEIKNLDSLCISLDGDEQANDKNRGKGTYQKIIEAIKVAKENGLPVLTSTVLTANNIETGAIEKILELSQKIGFGAQFNFLYEQTTEFFDDPACKVQEEAIKKAIVKLIQLKRKGLPVFYSTATYNNALNWPDKYTVKKFTSKNPPPQKFKYIPCYMGKLMCFVDGDGLVYPCGEHIGKFPALNIRDVGFKKAWENIEKQKDCISCYNTCFNEYNNVFSCRTSVIWNNFLNSIKNTKK